LNRAYHEKSNASISSFCFNGLHTPPRRGPTLGYHPPLTGCGNCLQTQSVWRAARRAHRPHPEDRLSPAQADLVDSLGRVARGDRAAFRLLYGRTAGKLLGVIRRILRSEGAAEDALQEAYVRIWQNAARFDPAIASPIAWMTTIARHAAIDALRRGGERLSAASVTIDGAMGESLAAPDSRADPLAAGRLQECLEGLDGERKSMLVLAYCEGWSREELARRFERPVATVKTLLRRGLAQLKECLGGN
jgi:RNA polymerase sigma-70 factor (ECF subfamily)